MSKSQGFWAQAMRRLFSGWLARGCVLVLLVFLSMTLAGWAGLVAKNWDEQVAVSYANPNFMKDAPNPQGEASRLTYAKIEVDEASRAVDPLAPNYAKFDELEKQYHQDETPLDWSRPMGADKQGRDIVDKVIKASQVSITVGVMAAVFAVLIGTVLGALGGYFGGIIDAALEWVYSVFTAMPYILLVMAIASIVRTPGISTVVFILAITGWTGTYRLIRSEYVKQRGREYVQAANAIGASNSRRMFIHILPNVSHLMLVQLSQLVVDFIKSEVVLSFLGFGVPSSSVSWGVMISEVRAELVLGKWWQLAAAAGVMSLFVVTFGLFTDLLRDALDPKARRK
ncbi:ABC transporter permease [Chitinivorax sp. B]|uniref:ABC transporter permease n=1 Tax=Chitinivorax sp. B TaxID=2502235 RepID=UPI0020170F2B|nr:ABC transporter permease [Chitinivorax sp. B]